MSEDMHSKGFEILERPEGCLRTPGCDKIDTTRSLRVHTVNPGNSEEARSKKWDQAVTSRIKNAHSLISRLIASTLISIQTVSPCCYCVKVDPWLRSHSISSRSTLLASMNQICLNQMSASCCTHFDPR